MIVREAKETGNNAEVARRFNVPPQNVTNWLREEESGKLRSTIHLPENEIHFVAHQLAGEKHKLVYSIDSDKRLAKKILKKILAVMPAKNGVEMIVQPNLKKKLELKKTEPNRRVERALSESDQNTLALAQRLSPKYRQELDRHIKSLFRLQMRDVSDY
jgi:hypothetical protein